MFCMACVENREHEDKDCLYKTAIEKEYVELERIIKSKKLTKNITSLHTPTPWKVEVRPVEISGSFYEVVGAKGVPTSILVERIDQDLSSRSSIKNHEADAAFIVQAVNSYEAYAEVLRRIAVTDPLTVANYAEWVRAMACFAIAKAEDL